ncbi:hypothetical protein [Mesorhizobium argentiipisi]|uniref:Uncharacterized protein n=1 Tax=Mesorhizobium argentiipisi TaxID=3015175 RepID=A0ABU8KKC2_9HYPH
MIAPKTARYSIPFFYEPRVDAEIAPLPIEGASDFAPFLYAIISGSRRPISSRWPA